MVHPLILEKLNKKRRDGPVEYLEALFKALTSKNERSVLADYREEAWDMIPGDIKSALIGKFHLKI